MTNLNLKTFQKLPNDDLVSLNVLNEDTVLDELKKRYNKNQIYTYIGDILIAMNPLKTLPIYDKSISNVYKSCDDNLRASLPPHVFATAEQCYREMIQTQKSQCILISGESGSGKTETCKYLVEHLLNRTKQFEVCLNTKIQQVNPILEAFGNAKTRINDNSSRFGKYLEIYFKEGGTVVGAKFKEYLLEKSRIVYQNDNESTFHIFYQLLSGLNSNDPRLNSYLITNEMKHRYIINTVDYKNHYFLTKENKEKFNSIIESMKTIGFLIQDIDNVIRVLVSILHIGDIVFTNINGGDAVHVKNLKQIQKICELLEIDANKLNDAFVSDVQITRGEEIRRERNMIQSCEVRDALAKALYGRLFSWIVNQINHHIQPAEGVTPYYSIGLLDIFGFENFQKNSFEQICINLANEQLHQLFAEYIFKLEIQECKDENIELNDDDLNKFQDNQIILDLFLKKQNSIFALLDEVSKFPQATDDSLAIKFHQILPNLYPDVYIPPKNNGVSFHIVHYAGQVSYNVEGFLEKNRDFLPNNIFYVARTSKNLLVQELFECKLTRRGTIAPSDRQSKLRKSIYKTPYQITRQVNSVYYSPNNQNNESNEKRSTCVSFRFPDERSTTDKALPLTVACHFKNSLYELIEKINTCKIYFIRCIKPSPRQENEFVNDFVTKQLRYCSIMHVCKIRKCGFPYRIHFDEFLKWYKSIELCILNETKSRDLNKVQKCVRCLTYCKITNYKIGKTKLFLRYWHIDTLNEISRKFLNQIITIQKVIRGWLVRKRFKQMQQQKAKLFFLKIEEKTTQIYNHISEINKSVPLNKIHKMNEITVNQSATTTTTNAWPDQTEINSALEEFDQMLNKYDQHDDNSTSTNNGGNVGVNHLYIQNKSPKKHANAVNEYNRYGVNKSPSFKVSPTAVYHIVHNNNNKNDNTLKKKNALVAFEFKKIISQVKNSDTDTTTRSSSSSSNNSNHEISRLTEIENNSNSYHYNHQQQQFNSNLAKSKQLTSTSLININQQHINQNTINTNTSTNNNNNNNNNTKYQNPTTKIVQNFDTKIDNYNNNNRLAQNSNSNIDNNNNNSSSSSITDNRSIITTTNNNNINTTTIWREELNAKNNTEQRRKKENELSKKVEDSKKLIPEWKLNLLKQKEMKRASTYINNNNNNQQTIQQQQQQQQQQGLNLNYKEAQTPELMKHNIFIKKGLATYL